MLCFLKVLGALRLSNPPSRFLGVSQPLEPRAYKPGAYFDSIGTASNPLGQTNSYREKPNQEGGGGKERFKVPGLWLPGQAQGGGISR